MIRLDCKRCHQYEAQAEQGGLCYECASAPIPMQSTRSRANGQAAIPREIARRTSWSASDLLGATFDDPRFAVDGLMPEGLTFMCGAPKLGKSWLALGLAIAVASGGKALGSVPVERGEALYLALEDSPRRLQTRLRMLLPDEVAPAGLRLETEWPRLDEGGTDRLDEWLDAQPSARLVLVDVWPRIRPRVTKRSSDQYTLDYDGAALLQGLAIARGIAIVALYHTRKAESADFVETVTGTFGTAAAADTIVVVKRSRGQADAVLHVTGRDVEERELALRFAPEAGTWVLIGDAAEYALGETRKELLDLIRDQGALTPKQAADISGISHDLVRQTLLRMAKDGQVNAKSGRYTLISPVTAVASFVGGVTERPSGVTAPSDRVTPVTEGLGGRA